MQPEDKQPSAVPETNETSNLSAQRPIEPPTDNQPEHFSADAWNEDDQPLKNETLGADDANDADDEANTTPAPILPATTTKHSFFNVHKRMIIIGVAVTLLAGGAVGFALATGNKETPSTTTTQKKAAVLLAAEASVVDGLVEVSEDAKTWQVLKVGDQVTSNQSVRTGANGRAVIAIDDGSALRVNNSSEIKVVSLESNDIEFTNVTGEVYARVVPSKRSFTVAVADETYTAKGTAYKTINRDKNKGVEVYHSTVALGTAKTDVAEGKRYFESNADVALVKKTTDIPTDQLSKDAFLAWNLEKDKESTEYASALGYLRTLEQQKLDAAQKPAATPATVPAPVSTSGIKLSATKTDTGIKLTWTLSGVTAEKGFKIVKGTKANPTFGVDSATYVSSSTTRSYTWALKDGKTYNFRVCTYTGDSCTNYSNNASATAPLYTTSYPTPSGTVTLANVSGKNVEWTLNGSAPNGYKLVWSTSPNPVYPGSSAAFYDKNASNGAVEASADGTYYVRVCLYTGSGCSIYSNQITITLP